MNGKNVQHFLNKISVRLFRFIHALIPDDLQTQQIVIDSWALFLSNNRISIDEKLENIVNKQLISTLFKKDYIKLLIESYKMALKRYPQIEVSIRPRANGNENDHIIATFNKLDIKEKAILYLYYVDKLTLNEIQFIIGDKSNDFKLLLLKSRGKLLEYSGTINSFSS